MLEYTISSYSGFLFATPQYLGEGDSGLILTRDDSTNSAEVLHSPTTELPEARAWTVDSTFSYAMSRYGDLLRKLAN